LDVCQTCKGSGAKPGTNPTKCSTCAGVGQVIQTGLGGMFRMQTTCPSCRGRGSVVADRCGDCRGAGRVPMKRTLNVKLPAGIHDGQVVRVQSEGEPPPQEASAAGEGIRGDLHVVVRVQDHDQFEREGDDLMFLAPIAFTQLALGAVTQVPTLDGIADVNLPAGTQHGEMFRVPGAGLPNLRSGKRGDLIVIVQLVVPKKLNDSQKKMLAEYAKTESVEVGNAQQPSTWQRIKRAMKGD
jgi:molecular chaperone DnaJ